MASLDLKSLLQRVRSGELDVAEAERALGLLALPALARLSGERPGSIADLGYAQVDLDRKDRLGLPEVVFGEPKTAAEIVGIVRALVERRQNALVTRVGPARAAEVQAEIGSIVYHERARCLILQSERRAPRFRCPIAVVTAGTGDIPVAEEASVTLELAGETVERIYDVGVAGLHRLIRALPSPERVGAVICVAGMEGALPSVLGGLIRVPVFAVPTSVGYGVSAGGFAALAGMLASCSAGVTVVNIDNGFGAAMAVLRCGEAIERQAGKDGAA